MFNLKKSTYLSIGLVGIILLFTSTFLAILFALITSFLWNLLFLLPGDIFILASFLLGGGIIYYLLKIFKRNFRLSTLRQKVVFSFVTISCIVYLGIVGFFLSNITNEGPIQAFPFDDKKATYTVQNIDGYYWINYNSPSNENKFTNCRTYQTKELCEEGVNHDVSVYVATSRVDLKPFVDKKVKIQGEFIDTNKQCVVDICKSIGGNNSFTGVKITSISNLSSN